MSPRKGETREKYLARKRAYSAAHREERLAYNAAHREEKRDYNAAYRAANREEGRNYKAAYDAAHREEKRDYNAAYHQRQLEFYNGNGLVELFNGRLDPRVDHGPSEGPVAATEGSGA